MLVGILRTYISSLPINETHMNTYIVTMRLALWLWQSQFRPDYFVSLLYVVCVCRIEIIFLMKNKTVDIVYLFVYKRIHVPATVDFYRCCCCCCGCCYYFAGEYTGGEGESDGPVTLQDITLTYKKHKIIAEDDRSKTSMSYENSVENLGNHQMKSCVRPCYFCSIHFD